MNNKDNINDNSAESMKNTNEERNFKGISSTLVPTFGILWAIFQIFSAIFPEKINSTALRSIHLSFALIILFLNIPYKKNRQSKFLAFNKILLFFVSSIAICSLIEYFSYYILNSQKISLNIYFFATLSIFTILSSLHFIFNKTIKPFYLDIIIAFSGSLSALFIFFNYEIIAARSGMPLPIDLITGISLIIILFEASRRVIGPALTIIILSFTLYAFFGPYFPGSLSWKGVSLSRFIGQVSMADEGIYGIPLGVSARTVFLFVLFGAMLNIAGGGLFFINVAMSLLGRFKGGPAKAAVIGSGLTGMISGSSIANIVTTGTFTIPMMKKVGYPAEKAAAIEVAASTDGQIAPPIMGAAAFIMAEYLGISYISVIKYAVIPAFVSYMTLLYITHIEAGKLGLKKMDKADIPNFKKSFLSGFHFLIPIGALMYFLIIKRYSPHKSASYAIGTIGFIMIFQPLFSAFINKRSLLRAFTNSIKLIGRSFSEGSKSMVSIAIATASAGIVVAIISLGPGSLITQMVVNASMGNIYLMLLITAIACLIIGMGLPTTATYVVMASLTAPIIITVANSHNFFVPLAAAHLFAFYFGILADDTPPVGLAAYAAATIAKSNPIKTGIQAFVYDIRTAIIPFMFIFNSDLLLFNINSITEGILIFIMTCIGGFAFASATTGYYIRKNKIYETILLLLITFIMFQPGYVAKWLGIINSNVPRSSVSPPEIFIKKIISKYQPPEVLINFKDDKFISFSYDGRHFQKQTKNSLILKNNFQNIWFFKKDKNNISSETNRLTLYHNNGNPYLSFYNFSLSKKQQIELMIFLQVGDYSWTTHSSTKTNYLYHNWEKNIIHNIIEIVNKPDPLSDNKISGGIISIKTITETKNKYWIYLIGLTLFFTLGLWQWSKNEKISLFKRN